MSYHDLAFTPVRLNGNKLNSTILTNWSVLETFEGIYTLIYFSISDFGMLYNLKCFIASTLTEILPHMESAVLKMGCQVLQHFPQILKKEGRKSIKPMKPRNVFSLNRLV